MKRRHLLAASAVTLLLAGCASNPVPEGYKGPLATIHDTGEMETGARARFFYLAQIGGSRVENSFSQSRRQNAGRGMAMLASSFARQVPAQPLVLRLEARIAYGAPIQEIFMAASMYSATRIIEFEPQPDAGYVVKGVLTAEKSEVWLERLSTGERVGRDVTP